MGLDFRRILGAVAPIAGSFFGPVGTMVGGAIGGALNQSATNRENRNIANNQANTLNAAAQQGAEMSRFRPVNVSTGLGQSQFTTDANGNPTGATVQMDPRLSGIMGGALGQAGQAFSGSTDPAALQGDLFSQWQASQAAPRQQMFGQLQDRLQAQGLNGLNVGMPSGGSGNPFHSAMAEGWGRADNQAWQDAWMRSSALADAEQNRGIGALNAGLGIDKYGQSLIGMGSDLGARTSTAGALGGDLLFRAGVGGAGAQAGAAQQNNANNNALFGQLIGRMTEQFGTDPNAPAAPIENRTMPPMGSNWGWGGVGSSPY